MTIALCMTGFKDCNGIELTEGDTVVYKGLRLRVRFRAYAWALVENDKVPYTYLHEIKPNARVEKV